MNFPPGTRGLRLFGTAYAAARGRALKLLDAIAGGLFPLAVLVAWRMAARPEAYGFEPADVPGQPMVLAFGLVFGVGIALLTLLAGPVPGHLSLFVGGMALGWYAGWPWPLILLHLVLTAVAIRLLGRTAPEGRFRFGGSGRGPFLAGAAIVLLFFVVRYHGGEASHVPIHDNLDGNVPRYVLMATSPIFASLDAVVPQAMGGLPKNSMHSDLTLIALLFRFLSPFVAYVLNEFFVRLAAFAGMYLLLKDHAAPRAETWIRVGGAVAFALIPFWPGGTLNAAGQPLLWWAVMNMVKRRTRIWDWAVIVLFPAASMLVMVGWWIAPAMGVVFLVDAWRKRRPNGVLFGAICAITLIYIGVEYRALYQTFFDTDYVSHRSEFEPGWFSFGVDTPRDFIRYFWETLRDGGYYSRPLQKPFMLAAIAGVVVALMVRPRETGWTRFRVLLLSGAVVLILVCTLADALGYYTPFRTWTLEAQEAGILNTIEIRRMNRALPALWSFVFIFMLTALNRRGGIGSSLALLLLLGQIILPFHLYQAGDRAASFFPEDDRGLDVRKEVTFGQYYSVSLFERVREFIGRPQASYRVVGVGLFPGILNYNGFYTADGYFPNYPVEYKHRFGRLIGPELEKHDWVRETAFEGWASYCVIFPSENPFLLWDTTRWPEVVRFHLALNPEAYDDLGIDYVFSRVRLDKPEEIRLRFIRMFEDENSPWRVYLYGTLEPEGREEAALSWGDEAADSVRAGAGASARATA